MPRAQTPKVQEISDASQDTEHEDISEKNKTREGAEQAAAFSSLTDHQEEKVFKPIDTSHIRDSMVKLAAHQKAELDKQRQREKELAGVKIAAENVAVIVQEFEIDKKRAERVLREAGGDLKQALQHMIET